MTDNFRSGYAAIAGRPNVGKSTLLNRLTGEKVAIVSSKPQTTRDQILAVATGDAWQIIFMDTPGLHTPRSKLGKIMVKNAEAAVTEADIILFMTDAKKNNAAEDAEIIGRFAQADAPVFLVINKIDLIPKADILSVIERYKAFGNFAEIIPISAATGENVAALMDCLLKYLPEGPQYYPEDFLTDQPERQIISEIIREKALALMQDEIPHGIAVETTAVKKKSSSLTDVDAVIYCEKDSHKGMIIGKNGAMLKKIGQMARPEIENLLGTKIFLQTWVKVKKNWRNDDFVLNSLGFGNRLS